MVRCCLRSTCKCSRLPLRDQSGFSLLEIMVAVAIMTTVGAFSTNLMTTGADHVKHVHQKAALSELRREVVLANQDNPTCTFNLSVATDASLVFDSTANNTTMYVNRLRSGPNLTSSIVAEVNGVIGDSGLTVDQIRITNLADNGSGVWTGIWKITFKPRSTDGYIHRELTLSPQAFEVDRTVPAVAKIIGCAAGVLPPLEWLVTGNAPDPNPAVTNYSNYYMGTTTNVDIVFRRNGSLNGLINSLSRRTQWGVDTILSLVGSMDASAFGTGALFANTGADNTALGDFALNSNTTGQSNTAVGSKALRANSLASNNTAVGASALTANTTGEANTAVGADALASNISGNNNTAIGVRSQMNNTSGWYNTSFGNDSLMANSIADAVTAIGYKSLESSTGGGGNTAIGNFALRSNTTGGWNVAAGHSALTANTTGGFNTAIGTPGALSANTTGSYNTALGGDSLNANTTGTYNTSLGHGTMRLMQTGNFNTAAGKDALSIETTGNFMTAIGYRACSNCSGSYFNSTSIGANAQVTDPNMIRLGDTNVTVIEGAVLYVQSSDQRLKENIANYPHGLDLILKLRPVKYNLTTHTKQNIHSGFIAQEVEKTNIPFHGLGKPASDKGFYSLDYAQFVVPLVNAVKEIHFDIRASRQKLSGPQKLLIEKLKRVVENREHQINELEAINQTDGCHDE